MESKDIKNNLNEENLNEENLIDDKLREENIENNIFLKKQSWKKKENLYCNNCGKHGHLHKKCFEPKTSYGIICMNLNNKKIYDFFVSKYKFPPNNQQLKNICINKYIQKNISCNNKKDLDLFENKIVKTTEYLMVRRKYSYDYIHIIRGLYDMNIENLIKSINLLTKREYSNILNSSFDELWEEIWQINAYKLEFRNEYNRAKDQYMYFKTYILPQIQHKINIVYTIPEWGFPKGKRDNNETNLECAVREFEEETGLDKTEYIILDRLYPLIEYIKGSNGIEYKHVYFIGLFNNNFDTKTINKKTKNIHQQFEIGDIGVYNSDQINDIVRSYDTEKKDIINTIKIYLTYNTRYFEKFYHENKNV
jgi:ADP-ribose pyrophosphatase YjhB (NUDIX family)